MTDSVTATSFYDLLLWVVKGLVTFVCAVFGWALRKQAGRIDELEAKVERMEDSITNVRIDLPTNYLTKMDFKIFEDRLFGRLEEMEKSLRT
jgi:hypothetical protein